MKSKPEVDPLAKWANVPKFAGKYGKVQVKPKAEAKQEPTGFKKANYVVGVGAKPQEKKYTGTEMLGITIIHKSCLQPVFNQEAAIDAAKMRR